MNHRTPRHGLLLLVSCFICVPSLTRAQTVATPAPAPKESSGSIVPGPKPPDAPAEWKRFVGIYVYSDAQGDKKLTVVILERHQEAFMRYATDDEQKIRFRDSETMIVPDPIKGEWVYRFVEEPGSQGYFSYLTESYVRTDAGSDPSRFYHITPSKPIAQLRAAALSAKPPNETQHFRQPDLVELVTLDPSIHLDIRYAQSNNFLSTPLYTQARAFMQRPAADALVRVSRKLQHLGYGLLIHDAYRPWYVTKMFWDATPPEGKQFVADPAKGSKHNRGCAVDLTLYDLSTGKPLEMPGLYDEMSPRSYPDYPGGTSLQRWNRDLLRRAMESEGFTVNESEWWHFDYKDWTHYQIMNVRFEDWGKTPPPSSTVSH